MSIMVIKIGGSTVDAEGLLRELGQSIAQLGDDIFPIIVHGGGKDIAAHLSLLNREFTFIEGMRVTDAQMVKIVQMVLSGDVNKRIVNALLKESVNACGFSGVDSSLFTASKMLVNGKDIGFVGKIDKVNTSLIDFCKGAKLVPVISPVSRGEDGSIFNVNADLAASELATSIKADDLVFVSDVAGVMVNGEVLREIRTSEIEDLIAQGHITGGMIPKLRSAAESVHKGVKRIHICGWKDSQTLRNQINRVESTGTVISD
ncbi:acetylglutamate kinase [Chitinispirillales bacterium ANBcel5]|uniref:acetylglutamate kinase n=1 Tax=Cellulosispirillum alkaliphilum TaxID=3039283 RepID=UPI002A597849|nr:acetylglutamate kinase [Chitinispirillales bacterium ANBcel5]